MYHSYDYFVIFVQVLVSGYLRTHVYYRESCVICQNIDVDLLRRFVLCEVHSGQNDHFRILHGGSISRDVFTFFSNSKLDITA